MTSEISVVLKFKKYLFENPKVFKYSKRIPKKYSNLNTEYSKN